MTNDSISYFRQFLETIDEKKFGECYCGKVFENQQALKSHQKKFHLAKPRPCRVMKSNFITLTFGSKFLFSQICEQNFTCKKDLIQHWMKKHFEKHGPMYRAKSFNNRASERRKYTCDLCGNKLQHIKSLKSHFSTVHGNITFYCDFCPKTFKYKNSLSQHMRQHQSKYKIFTCKDCNFAATSQRATLTHRIIVHGVKRCVYCRKNVMDLRKHIKDEHKEKPRVTCPICKLTFKKFSLKGHIKYIHEMTKKCADCGEIVNSHRMRT